MDSVQADFPAPAPTMSRTKQARIDIWRNEVALLTIPDAARPGSPESPASSLLSASPSRSSSSTVSPPREEESRTRRLWKKLGVKILPAKTREKNSSSADDLVSRTRMYRDERVPDADKILNVDDIIAAAELASGDNGPGGLKEKQERLERAARLLDQGPTRDA